MPPAGSPGSASRGSNAGGARGFIEPHGDNSIPTYGAEAPASEERQAEATLGAYLRARGGGDWGGACSYLTAAMRSQLERLAAAARGKSKGCGAILKAFSGRGPASTRANPLTHGLTSLRVKGRTAFALFYGPHGQKYVMPMAHEGGAWKVTQLAPIAYPPGAPSRSP